MSRLDNAARNHGGASCAIACAPASRACRGLPSSTSCCCPLGVLLALAWVNIEPESYYRVTFAIAFAVNDVAIALFFALITKEVVEATAPGGVLHPWRRAMLPVVACARRGGGAGADSPASGRRLRRSDAGGRLARHHGDGPGDRLLRRAADLQAAPDRAAVPAAGHRLRRAGLRGADAVPPHARDAPDCRRADGRLGDAHRRRPSETARPQLLAVPAWRGRRVVAGPLLERPAPGAGARADHAVSPARRRAIPASSSTRGRTRKDTLSQFEVWWRYPAQVAFLLRPRQRGRAHGRARSRHVGAAARGPRRPPDRPARGNRPRPGRRLPSAASRRMARTDRRRLPRRDRPESSACSSPPRSFLRDSCVRS